MSSRHICPICNLHPHQQWCVHKISNSKTFAAIHLFISSHKEIKDFCSMDKKTGRRYGRRLFNYKIVLHIIVYVFILQAAECNHAATNSVILYKTKSHTYVHIHLVIFTSYKIYAIYKSTHNSASPKT